MKAKGEGQKQKAKIKGDAYALSFFSTLCLWSQGTKRRLVGLARPPVERLGGRSVKSGVERLPAFEVRR